jgi:hypothetical protein
MSSPLQRSLSPSFLKPTLMTVICTKTPTKRQENRQFSGSLTVRFLVAGTGTWTTELLWLGASRVGNKECTVVLDESLLELVLGVLIDELLVVGDDGLGDGLANGIDLGNVTTTGDADTDVDTGELVKANNQKRLVDLYIHPQSAPLSFLIILHTKIVESYLEAQDLGLDQVERLAVDLNEALALLKKHLSQYSSSFKGDDAVICDFQEISIPSKFKR